MKKAQILFLEELFSFFFYRVGRGKVEVLQGVQVFCVWSGLDCDKAVLFSPVYEVHAIRRKTDE